MRWLSRRTEPSKEPPSASQPHPTLQQVFAQRRVFSWVGLLRGHRAQPGGRGAASFSRARLMRSMPKRNTIVIPSYCATYVCAYVCLSSTAAVTHLRHIAAVCRGWSCFGISKSSSVASSSIMMTVTLTVAISVAGFNRGFVASCIKAYMPPNAHDTGMAEALAFAEVNPGLHPRACRAHSNTT